MKEIGRTEAQKLKDIPQFNLATKLAINIGRPGWPIYYSTARRVLRTVEVTASRRAGGEVRAIGAFEGVNGDGDKVLTAVCIVSTETGYNWFIIDKTPQSVHVRRTTTLIERGDNTETIDRVDTTLDTTPATIGITAIYQGTEAYEDPHKLTSNGDLHTAFTEAHEKIHELFKNAGKQRVEELNGLKARLDILQGFLKT